MAPESARSVHIVGGGLAGSEAALQLAHMGYSVTLYEMRPLQSTPAHKTGSLAELVCSNSFGSFAAHSAPGLLKWETEELGCFLLDMAWKAYVPAGMALGIDRKKFSEAVDKQVRSHPKIKVSEREILDLSEVPRPAIIATGPLTSADLSRSLMEHIGSDFLYFFDAIAPIVDSESIDRDTVFVADRFGKGSGDYLNCPLTKEQYYDLMEDIAQSEKVEAKDFEKDTPYFEGCMPIEEMASRGVETLRHGPLSGKGLTDPKTDRWPYAAVQLRKENKAGTSYNLVGFQTKMKYGEQIRIFRKIPGLENAEFLKLGSIHRNLFINSPHTLNPNLSSRKDPRLFFAGQITGVEGYFESIATGLLAARFLDEQEQEKPMSQLPRESALGSILNEITMNQKENFQPTNINFGLLPPVEKKMPKKNRRDFMVARAKKAITDWEQPFKEKVKRLSLRTQDEANRLAEISAAR